MARPERNTPKVKMATQKKIFQVGRIKIVYVGILRYLSAENVPGWQRKKF